MKKRKREEEEADKKKKKMVCVLDKVRWLVGWLILPLSLFSSGREGEKGRKNKKFLAQIKLSSLSLLEREKGRTPRYPFAAHPTQKILGPSQPSCANPNNGAITGHVACCVRRALSSSSFSSLAPPISAVPRIAKRLASLSLPFAQVSLSAIF